MASVELSGGEGDTESDPKLSKTLRALKFIDKQVTELEVQFYKDVHELEKKYNGIFEGIFAKREEITSGKTHPEKEDLAEGDIVTARLGHIMVKSPKVVGVPNFWFWVFKNSAKLYELVQRTDVPILTSLTDIKLVYKDEPMGFVLEFRFAPNSFFSNEVLTKEYSGSTNLTDVPPSFDSPVINSSKGCVINWYPGMDPSYRMVNMQQQNQLTKASRVIAKPVKMKTFFNFFSPPTLPEDPNVELRPDYLASVTRDYEIGLYFREEIIPNAYLFFTAQMVEKDDNFVDMQILPDRPAQHPC